MALFLTTIPIMFSYGPQGVPPYSGGYLLTTEGVQGTGARYLGSYPASYLSCNISGSTNFTVYGPDDLIYILNQGTYIRVPLTNGTYTLVLSQGGFEFSYFFTISNSDFSLKQTAGNWIFFVEWMGTNTISYKDPSPYRNIHFSLYESYMTPGQNYYIPIPLTINQIQFVAYPPQVPEYILDGTTVDIPDINLVTVPLSVGDHTLVIKNAINTYTILFTVINTVQSWASSVSTLTCKRKY